MARLARFATIVVLALAALAAATVTGSDNNLHRLRAFEAFATKHKRHYRDAADKAAAFGHFRRRMAQAAELQARNPHATFGATKFADQPIRQRKPLKKPLVTPEDARAFAALQRTLPAATELPPLFNWQARGAVGPVLTMQDCGGNCVAMPMAEIGTSLLYIQGYTRELTPLSSQQIVDCDPSGQCGCNGCMPSDAGAYLTNSTVRWDSAASYPTTGTSGTCMAGAPQSRAIAKMTQYIAITAESQTAVMQSLQRSPVGVGLNAMSFQSYTGGILTDCPSGQMDHAALLVGYNTTSTPPYWIVKNEWGTDWGEAGYVWIAMQGDNCNILDMPWTLDIAPV
jgi:hypothetical protein